MPDTMAWKLERVGSSIIYTIECSSEYQAVVMCDHLADEIKANKQVKITIELMNAKIDAA